MQSNYDTLTTTKQEYLDSLDELEDRISSSSYAMDVLREREVDDFYKILAREEYEDDLDRMYETLTEQFLDKEG